MHSDRSADSRTPPGEVVRWYAGRGFDFIVFTDHNAVTELGAAAGGRMLVLPGVELTQNLDDCLPAPEPGERCYLHVNALLVRRPSPAELPWPRLASRRRLDVYDRALAVARALGGLAQLNHPNFHHGADAGLVVEVGRRGAVLVEIANMSDERDDAGDERHPPTEALWDAALTAGVTLYGVASDDAHHYGDAARVRARGGVASTGDRGFVMVRARREAEDIRAALARGDFYASTGLLLDDVRVEAGSLVVDVGRGASGTVVTRFVGTGGRLLATVPGLRPRFRLADARPGYVRAVVTDGRGRRAWVQPVRVP